ncbi:MAG: DUF3037 domain-containing protein [Anaerolineales bacterium]|nr:DUF3037 domain-containing protein [Anaerolineales bacterium]
MNSTIPFEYILIRYFHDPETEEFLNIGLVMYSPDANFFSSKILSKYGRITNTFPNADGDLYRTFISQIEGPLNKIVKKINHVHSQGLLFPEKEDFISHVLKIIPPNDASIRISEPKFGAAQDLDKMFIYLFERLVERHLEKREKKSRSDDEVWHFYREPLEKNRVTHALMKHTFNTPEEDFEFHQSWKNGKWNALKPLSFDLQKAGSIRAKAREWLGAEYLLNEHAENLGHLYFLLGAPQIDDRYLNKAYGDAKSILNSLPNGKFQIIEENEAEDFANEIKEKVPGIL